MQKLILIILLITISFSNPIGGFQGSFSITPSDAQSIGVGNVSIVQKNNVFGSQNNPALMNDNKYSTGLSYNNLSLDKYEHSFIASFKIPPSAKATIGYIGNGVKNIEGRGYNGKITNTYKWSNHHLFFAFGIEPIQKISIGLKFNIFFQDIIEEVKSSGLGIDIGLYSNPIEKLEIAFTLNNIKAKSNWKINMSDGTMRDYNEYFPLIYCIAGKYQLNSSINILSQSNFYKDSNLGYIGSENNIGFEYEIVKYSNPILLRCGFNSKNYSFGFSLPYKNLINLNYAFSIGLINAGNNHIFTWDLKL